MLASFKYGNDITHTTSLNDAGFPSTIKDSSINEDFNHLAYDNYDTVGNITRIADLVDTQFSLNSLEYDGLNRLISTSGNAGIGSSAIRYDGLGNILSYQTKGSSLSYQYNDKNQLHRVTNAHAEIIRDFANGYDNRGNVLSNGKRHFTYNQAAQLTVSDGFSYLYDGFNRRVKTDDAKGITFSVYSQSGTLYHRERNGLPVDYIYLGKKLIAKNGLFSEQSNTASSSNNHYTPYGKAIEGEKDDVGYTGHVYDTELDLSYMQARYYDPVIGRFYANDPVQYRGVHSFNRYNYAANNPYKFIDPTGMAEVFTQDGHFVEEVNPKDDNVYVQTESGNQSLNTTIEDFHRISSVVYGEGPATGRTEDESTAIANVIANSGDKREQSMLESATSGRFFGDGNDAATDYLQNWTQGGKTEAPAARAGVISVLTGQLDPTNGSTLFEGTKLLNSPLSNFTQKFVDTGVAHSPILIGNTTFFQEKNP